MTDDDGYTTKYFGERWNVPMLEDAEEHDTPVGDPCAHCDQAIRRGQQGIYRLHLEADGNHWRPVHRECDVRSVVGGYYHLLGDCICHGGDHDPDPEWANKREAALLAFGVVAGKGGAR